MYVSHDSYLSAFFCNLFSGTQQQGPTNLMNRIDDEITLQRASTMVISQGLFLHLVTSAVLRAESKVARLKHSLSGSSQPSETRLVTHYPRTESNLLSACPVLLDCTGQYKYQCLNGAATLCRYALLVSVFGFRFLDWWYTNDVGASASSSTPVVPAPPGRPVVCCHARHQIC